MPIQHRTVPVSEAAIQLRLSREQLIRRIQRGLIAGGRNPGWYVDRDALERAAAEQSAGRELAATA